MSQKSKIEERTWELMQPYLAELGLTGVDAEYVKEGGEYFLRCYIDKDGGVGVDDCEALSRLLDPKLDEEDLIPDAYTLEVSSPGLGRVLKRPRDFLYARGREVELRFYAPKNGKRELRGILAGDTSTDVTVVISGEERSFAKRDLSKISLAFDL